MWSEMNCVRKRKMIKQKYQNISQVLDERYHRLKYASMSSDILISSTVGCLKTSYYDREY